MVPKRAWPDKERGRGERDSKRYQREDKERNLRWSKGGGNLPNKERPVDII